MEIVKKPNQVCVIKNGAVTANQRKIYTAILCSAQKELKKNPNKTFFVFGYSELKEKSGVKATSNWYLKDDIESLTKIRIETMDDKDNWGGFVLISDYKKNNDSLRIELPITIREALINNNYYTAIDMLIIKSLEGKYALILYELVLRYEKVQIPELTIEEFRELTGITDCYKYFGDIRARVLEPAILEISEKTDIILSYTEKKRGNRVTHIKFHMVRQTNEKFDDFENQEKEDSNTFNNANNDSNKSDSGKIEQLIELLPESEPTDSWKKLIKRALQKYTFELIRIDILYTIKQNPKNLYGYFAKSIENADGLFSSHDNLKKEKDKESAVKKEEKIKNKMEEENKRKELLKTKIEEVYQNLSEEDISRYEKEYNRLHHISKQLSTKEMYFKELIREDLEKREEKQ